MAIPQATECSGKLQSAFAEISAIWEFSGDLEEMSLSV